ncbi:PEP-CTERM sorting domain-containing protein [Poriferisphaera sp. WC338]|uniref:PEP-CTERM sorting domain-containing protein n=1 Tax=Poriferisphaera sp. WC338 TaxID=3425129 RepID=UPI003D813C01
MRRTSRLALSLVAALGLSVVTAQADASITWDYEYTADVLPNDGSLGSGAWTVGGTHTAGPSVSGGVLTLDTGFNQWQNGYMLYNGSEWDSDDPDGTTFEVRIKVADRTGTQHIQIGKQNYYWELLVSKDRISSAESASDGVAAGGPGVDLDMTQYHTIRVTISAGGTGSRVAQVYIDDNATPAFTLNGFFANLDRIVLADGGGSTYWGAMDVDYIRWVNGEATAPPVPEPATLGLIGLGVLMLTRRP